MTMYYMLNPDGKGADIVYEKHEMELRQGWGWKLAKMPTAEEIWAKKKKQNEPQEPPKEPPKKRGRPKKVKQ